MERLEILELAYTAQLARWAKAKDILDAVPGNRTAQETERKAWNKLDEIHTLIVEEEERGKK